MIKDDGFDMVLVKDGTTRGDSHGTVYVACVYAVL